MSRSASLRNQIKRYERRLQLLKEQKALHGLDTPPGILIEVYHVILDGKEVYVSNPTLERPTLLWFGNPAQADSDGAWSSLEIEHIAVEGLNE